MLSKIDVNNSLQQGDEQLHEKLSMEMEYSSRGTALGWGLSCMLRRSSKLQDIASAEWFLWILIIHAWLKWIEKKSSHWSNLSIGYTQFNMKHSRLKCVSGTAESQASPTTEHLPLWWFWVPTTNWMAELRLGRPENILKTVVLLILW